MSEETAVRRGVFLVASLISNLNDTSLSTCTNSLIDRLQVYLSLVLPSGFKHLQVSLTLKGLHDVCCELISLFVQQV